MKQEDLNLIIQIVELAGDVGTLKGERDALKRENEYLRGLIDGKLAELDLRVSAIGTTESA